MDDTKEFYDKYSVRFLETLVAATNNQGIKGIDESYNRAISNGSKLDHISGNGLFGASLTLVD